MRLYTHTHTHTHTHTDALDNNKNKNNITTSDKHKPNIVGVGVPKGITDLYSHVRSNNSEMLDDPLIKQKYTKKSTSNNPISNIAITLIALIITVIVLLILAGVTINMLMGENGIINKAQLAKEKTNESQEQEMENLKNLENEITTRTGESYTKLQSTILYPNGTEENPAILTNNQRIEIENPYKGHNVYAVAEIYFNNVWGETGFVYEGGSNGVKATQIQGDNIDKIVVQSGGICVMTWSSSSGNGFNNSENIVSAPFRVKVFCLD